MSRFLRLSGTGLYVIALGLVACSLQIRTGLWHGDAFWHLTNGLWMLQHGAVLHKDIWSWTAAGTPWNNLEWGYDLLIGLTYKLGGAYGPIGLTIVLALAAIWLADRLAQRAGVSAVWRLVYWLVAMCLIVVFVKIRPQMASYALFPALLWLLPWMEKAPWKKVVAGGFVLGLVWANLHGSFLLGFLIPAFFYVAVRVFEGRWERGYLLWAGAFFAGTLVNPNGPGLLLNVAAEMANPLMSDMILEWRSPNLHMLPLLVALLVALAALCAGVFRNQVVGRKAVLWSFALVLLVAWLYSSRYIPYLMMALPWATGWAWPKLRPVGALARQRGMQLLAVFLCASFAWLLVGLPGNSVQAAASPTTPVKAVAYMKAHRLTCRVFNTYEWGGYLIFSGIKPWIDGRADLYMKTPILSDFKQVYAMTDPSLVFNNPRLRPDVILASTSRSQSTGPVDPYLSYVDALGWRVVFHSGVSEVLVPKGGAVPCG